MVREAAGRCSRGRRTGNAEFAASQRYHRPVAGSRSVPAPESLLGMLDPEDRAAVISLGRPRRYRRGAPIVIQGDHSDTVFVVVAGRVKVTVVTADGREILLAVDGPGELLGEFEAVDPESGPRTAANVALEPVECREITGEEFRDLLDTHPRIPLTLLRWTIRRLKWADRRRIDAASSDTTHRLARFLLELADNHAHADPSRVEIEIPLTQEELASLITASRDTVVRAIALLRSRRLIATARRRITILDINALREFAD
jgi:CRP/FNR family cyclic AMP-dependent transcriptional regulator